MAAPMGVPLTRGLRVPIGAARLWTNVMVHRCTCNRTSQHGHCVDAVPMPFLMVLRTILALLTGVCGGGKLTQEAKHGRITRQD